MRRLRWSSAGHPDPMLLLADGTVVDLAAPVGPPLGIGWLGRRVDGLATLPEGSTLLLFTDGLFERRGVPLDEGRGQVREILDRLGRPPARGAVRPAARRDARGRASRTTSPCWPSAPTPWTHAAAIEAGPEVLLPRWSGPS